MTYEAFHDELRDTRIALNNGAGSMPAVGFGTLFRDLSTTTEAVKCALEVGFRHFDCAERYRNETQIGEAFAQVFAAGNIRREDVFITTKLWNTNHRPERVKPAFEASCQWLQVDYLDCYLIHTPFAFQPGDDQDPRDAFGHVIYDGETRLIDTWHALEALVDEGRCKSIGLSDITLDALKDIVAAARIKPSVVQIESHPYLPEWEMLEFCKEHGIILLAFAPLGHGMEPNVLETPYSPESPGTYKKPRRKWPWPGRCNGYGIPDDLGEPEPDSGKLRYRDLAAPGDARDQGRDHHADPLQFRGRDRRTRFHPPQEVIHGKGAASCEVAPILFPPDC